MRQPVQIAVLVAAVRLHVLPSDPALRVVADLGIVPSEFGVFADLVSFILDEAWRYHK